MSACPQTNGKLPTRAEVGVLALTLEDIMKRFDLPRLIRLRERCDTSCDLLRTVSRTLEGADNALWLKLLTEFTNIPFTSDSITQPQRLSLSREILSDFLKSLLESR
jgi:hypothetical protein